MLASFFSWWLARIIELLPRAWTNATSRSRDGIVIEADAHGEIIASLRQRGLLSPIGLGAAARQVGRAPVLVRPRPDVVLVKHHTVPTAPRRQLEQLLRHELGRITPFPAQDLFWRWDGHPRPDNRARTDVVLTMVPRMALAPTLAALENVGLTATFIEVGPPDHPSLLPVGDAAHRAGGTMLVRGLTSACAGLAIIALALPLGLQAVALHNIDAAIDDLQPAISQVEALRRGIAAGDAGRTILAKEMERTGDVLQTLASVTRILPDDTYLTDFAVRERQMTLSGRSASAPRLITGLSADPTIRNIAFAAPVTRIDGTASDVFSIKAEVGK